MHILSVGTAVPPYRHTQDELLAKLEEAWAGRPPETLKRVRRFSQSSGVLRRHLSMRPDQYLQMTGFSERLAVYRQTAMDLAEHAIREALRAHDMHPADVDMILFTSVTGLSVPTIDAQLCNKLGFRKDIKRMPSFGLGCVAGAAGTARLHDYLQAYPTQVALLLSVELCSLTFQLEDTAVSNLVGVNLFGDGAAALVAVGAEHRLAGKGKLRTVATESRFYANTTHIMGWDIGAHGFKIVLDSGVPELVNEHLRSDMESFLGAQSLTISDIGTWVSHPGGPKVMSAIEASLQLAENALKFSWEHLRSHGNLSSSSVLFILRDTLAAAAIDPSRPALMLAMGPGFCAEFVLLAPT